MLTRLLSWLQRADQAGGALPTVRLDACASALEDLTGETPKVALVLTDVVDSTAVLHDVGNATWGQMLARHIHRARSACELFEGVVIDTTGDRVLCALPHVCNALAFVQALRRDSGDPRVRVRAAVHFGFLYVRTVAACRALVHFAARVLAHGEGDEIWCSEAAKVQLAAESAEVHARMVWAREERCHLKGIPGSHTLWRVSAGRSS